MESRREGQGLEHVQAPLSEARRCQEERLEGLKAAGEARSPHSCGDARDTPGRAFFHRRAERRSPPPGPLQARRWATPARTCFHAAPGPLG